MNYNKLKRSAEKITMPDDMKERIITRCHELEKNPGEQSAEEAEYSQQVSGVEKAGTHRITRMISAAAACAVIAGSIGTAAHFLKRSAPGTRNQMGGMEEVEVKNNPLTDFCDHDYSLSDTAGRIQAANLTEEQKSLFADFFNNCEYGEWTDKDAADAMIRSFYEAYFFIEKSETESTAITIDCNNCLTIERSSGEDPSAEPAVIEQYKIDYNLFSDTIKQIINADNNVNFYTKTYPFIDFEYAINNGAEIKYTLSDKPMPDLTEEQCQLLDYYFKNTFNKLEEAEGHKAAGYPVMIFEVKRSNVKSFFVQIYSDDHIIVRDDSVPSAKWYKYNGSRMSAEIEAIFRNGSIVDDNSLYPPFGNLAKNGGAYEIRRSGGDSVMIEGDLLHQLFYGYDWAECEITGDVDIMPAEFTFSYDFDDSCTSYVYISSNGLIQWTIDDKLTGKIIEEHWYQLTDTNVPDALSLRVPE